VTASAEHDSAGRDARVPRFDDDASGSVAAVAPGSVEHPGRNLAWVVVFGLAALQATYRVSSWDFWWHLAIGREAVLTRSTVPVDTFSYTFAGQPYHHKDLTADVLFYLAFDRIGFGGIGVLLACAVLVAAMGLRLGLGRHRPAVWMVMALAMVAAIQSRLIPRPLLFSECFFPLLLGLLEHARRKIAAPPRVVSGGAGGRRLDRDRAFGTALLPVVGLVWLWLNLHRGGVLGLIIVLGFALWTLLARAGALHARIASLLGPVPSWTQVAMAFGAFGGAVVAGTLNPSGLALYRTALAVTDDPIHQTMISEWAALTPTLALEVHPAATALIGCAFLVALLRLVWRATSATGGSGGADVDVWHVGVLVVTFAMSVSSVRYLSYASASAALALGLGWIAWLDARAARGRSFALPRGLPYLVALAGLVATAALNPHERGVGVAQRRYPEGALRAAEMMELGPRVRNAFVYGGYVIWEGAGRWRVAIDGRNDMLYPSEFFAEMVRGQRDRERFAAQWVAAPADWVLADNTAEQTCDASGCRERSNFLFLADDPGWMMVHWSEEAVIYVPRAGNERLADRAYEHLRANDLVGSLRRALRAADGDADALHAVRREVSRMVQSSPDSVRANALLAIFFHHLGPSHRMEVEAVLSRLGEIAPRHPAVAQLRTMLGPPR